MARIPLNDNQREFLAWIREGAPDGTYEDFLPRIVARALHNRGIAEVRGHGPTWQATLTEEGGHFLEHGDYLSARELAITCSSEAGTPIRTPRQRQSSRPIEIAEYRDTSHPNQRKMGPTDAMMAALTEAEDHWIKIDLDQVQRYRFSRGQWSVTSSFPIVYRSESRTTGVLVPG